MEKYVGDLMRENANMRERIRILELENFRLEEKIRVLELEKKSTNDYLFQLAENLNKIKE